MNNQVRIGLWSSGYEQFTSTKTFGSLDGLRAIAILAVVWHHATDGGHLAIILSRGFLGVDLFFVISGFLIVTLLLREQKRTGTIALRNFYIRRVLRIFPAYYLMLLLVAAIAVFNPTGATATVFWQDFPYALFFISNLVPLHSMLAITWSLSVEEQFYAVVPTIEKHLRRVLPFLFPVAYVLVSLPAFGGFLTVQLPSFFRETTFGPILLGVMLAHVLDNSRGFKWVSWLLGWKLAPVLALGAVVVIASHQASDMSGWPRLAAHWAFLALVAACVIRERNVLAPLLSLWPMRRIGAVSYGIYLYHLLTMHVALKLLSAINVEPRGVAAFLATALASWAVAELSYRFFEVHFLTLKGRFSPSASEFVRTDGEGIEKKTGYFRS